MEVNAKTRAASFGQWLDLTLEERNINSREVAHATGADESSVSRWRSGARKVPAKYVPKLAIFLDLDIGRLLVTAGVLDPQTAEPYPMPQPNPAHEQARKMLSRVEGLTKDKIDAMLKAAEAHERRLLSGNGA